MSLVARIGARAGQLDIDVALRAEPGQTIALLGPNGAGKTTILRCLAGLRPLGAGRIELDGRILDDPAADVFVDPRHRSVGMVFQDHVLFEHLSVRENVAYGLRAQGMRHTPALSAADALIEQMALTAWATERPAALSGGQRQRVALARALAPRPRLLLLDEPLAALDVQTRAAVRRDLVERLRQVDAVSILVTHDPVDAHALADTVVVVEAGHVVQQGPLNDLAAHPRSRYVGDLVGVNVVVGTVTAGMLRTAEGHEVAVADAADGPSVAVIRPHSVVLMHDVPVGTSARNTWHGRVTGIDRTGGRARVTLATAPPLVAEITTDALDALRLAPGMDVVATAKATDIEVRPT